MLEAHPHIIEILSKVPDPEIPVLTVIDLGIIRDIELVDKRVIVTITPTYSGCPAMQVFDKDIRKALYDAGYTEVEVKMTYHPAWTTDWISAEAREKLRNYGIAPPVGQSTDKRSLFGENKTVPCPQCNSDNTRLVSQFGSTACKAMYRCTDCLEPFEYFKCH